MPETVTCPKCSSPMVLRSGKFGPFYGCSRYRFGCRQTRPFSPGITAAARKAAPAALLPGSPEQEAIWQNLRDNPNHLWIDAFAGTGKSFTCRQGILRAPPQLRILYVVFGKENAAEFRAEAPANCEVKTLNAAGLAICRNAYPRAIIDENGDKVPSIIAELWQPKSDADLANQPILETAVKKLVDLCMAYLIDGQNQEELIELACRHNVELPEDIIDTALRLVPAVLSTDRERHNVLSFNDQVWFPITHNLTAPTTYDLIFVDEAQDLNRANHALVLKLLKPGGKVILVGDENQAIFGFRGSDVDSMANLARLLTEETGKAVTRLPLSVSRRCPKAVAAAAQEYVPGFKAMDDAPEGATVNITSDAAFNAYRPGDMVLCRINAPLAGIAYGLIKRGTKAVVKGRDIGQGLLALIRKLRAKSVNDLLKRLDQWADRELARVAGTRREATLSQNITDRADCIRALSEDCDNVSDVLARITSIFTDKTSKDAVVLSSGHKAKGLEAERVFWYDPSIACKAQQDWEVRQERNIVYVIITRVRKSTEPDRGILYKVHPVGSKQAA